MKFVALVSDIELGRGCAIDGPHGKIAVFRDSSGGIFALDDECGHLGASLSQGMCTDGVVDCWLRHGKYSAVTGERVRYPAFGSLRTYPVELCEGDAGTEIWVDVAAGEVGADN